MSLQIAKHLMRIALILLMFQFVAPAFIVASIESNTSQDSHVLNKGFAHSRFDTSFFEKEEKESEEDEKTFISLLLDFSELHNYSLSASQTNSQLSNTSKHLQAPPLFKLFCVFII
jgi:hypothetical protein